VSSVRLFTVSLAILLSAAIVAADNPAYQKGTLTVATASGRKSYNLKAGLKVYQISNCGDFQNGQEVEFIVKEDKIYIAHQGAKDYKCSIEATTEPNPNYSPGPVYMKGTILGFSIRRDLHVSGGGNGVSSGVRKAKTYELQGPDLIYQMDYCGAFQAGQFTPGQVVEFRVSTEESRLYILHDGDKEYSCQLEGTRKPDPQPGAAVQTAAASPASAAPAAAPWRLLPATRHTSRAIWGQGRACSAARAGSCRRVSPLQKLPRNINAHPQTPSIHEKLLQMGLGAWRNRGHFLP